MPSEQDPLLPRGIVKLARLLYYLIVQDKPAPEITGYGFSRLPNEDYQHPERPEHPEQEEDRAVAVGRASPFNTILGLFAFVVGLTIIIALLVPGGLSFTRGNNKTKSPDIKSRVNKILSENPLIDGHNDLAIVLRYAYGNKIYAKHFTELFEKGGLRGQVDLSRLQEGRSGGFFWSAFVECPKNDTDFSDANYAEAVSTTLSQIDVIRRLIGKYPKVFTPSVANSTVAAAAFATSAKLISPIGLEGLHQIGNSYSNLRLFESLGARYITLTHNCHNKYADAALTTSSRSGEIVVSNPYWGGVSDEGRVLIQEMNRIGMIVDLSHVSKDTMLDVLGGHPKKWIGSTAPIIFSHSSAYTLCPHPRNVPDDVLKLVKKTNSIVMVNFAPDFVSCTRSLDSPSDLPDFYPPNSTVHQVARHITYIGSQIGYDHVGIGSDFDGIPNAPKGLGDVSQFPQLVAELLKLGVSDSDAAKIVGRNILRVWGDVEKTAAKMQAKGILPAEDNVSERF